MGAQDFSDEQKRYLAKLVPVAYTEKTITRRDELRRTLADVAQAGYAIVDQSMRIMGGLKPVKNARVPVRVFDKSNIGQAGPKFTSGWGTTYVSGYRKLWGLQ